MGLFDRLVGDTAGDKLGVHAFCAALREWEDGQITRADIIVAFALTAEDEADLDWLKGKYLAAADHAVFIDVVEAILILGEEALLGYEVRANFVARVNTL